MALAKPKLTEKGKNHSTLALLEVLHWLRRAKGSERSDHSSFFILHSALATLR